jgi:tight adherence protein C
MNILQLASLALLFVTVFGLAWLALRRFSPNPLKHRLDDLAVRRPARGAGAAAPWLQRLVDWVTPLAKLSVPKDGWETSVFRARFMNAGFRHSSAPVVFFAAKTALAVILPALLLVLLNRSAPGADNNTFLLWLISAAALGYYWPNMVLKRITAKRQREIFESFPDALDLMTICVEAGLAIDAALARVALEIGLKSKILGDELHLVTLELRAGGAKDKALRNLALRTGVDDIDSFVAMLIQTERFGTSIADSLRVQSELLRTKRRQRAEEQAAQIGLKLLFPLIFFIFPALMLVLMGPAFIQIYRVLLPTLSAQ